MTETQRFRYELSFNVNYNRAKNLDTMGFIPDAFNRGLSKNLSPTTGLPRRWPGRA